MVIETTTTNQRKAPSVSIVIPVINERKTLPYVLQYAFKTYSDVEVIVVCNGTTDGSDRLAVMYGAKVLLYAAPLGHDVGRYVGALEAKGDIILFMDGDIAIPHHQLRPFIQAIRNGGVDIALNRYEGNIHRKNVHDVVIAKYALNYALSRADLRGSSLTTIPHAMSRNALQTIGAESLIVPPKAQAIAIHKGLVVQAVHFVDVGKRNPIKYTGRRSHPVKQLIVGDHLEAIHWFTEQTNFRGNMTDLARAREKVSTEREK